MTQVLEKPPGGAAQGVLVKKEILMEKLSDCSAIVSAQLIGAFYSALLLKQNSGIEITQDVEMETIKSIITRWKVLQSFVASPVPPEILEKSQLFWGPENSEK